MKSCQDTYYIHLDNFFIRECVQIASGCLVLSGFAISLNCVVLVEASFIIVVRRRRVLAVPNYVSIDDLISSIVGKAAKENNYDKSSAI